MFGNYFPCWSVGDYVSAGKRGCEMPKVMIIVEPVVLLNLASLVGKT